MHAFASSSIWPLNDIQYLRMTMMDERASKKQSAWKITKIAWNILKFRFHLSLKQLSYIEEGSVKQNIPSLSDVEKYSEEYLCHFVTWKSMWSERKIITIFHLGSSMENRMIILPKMQQLTERIELWYRSNQPAIERAKPRMRRHQR